MKWHHFLSRLNPVFQVLVACFLYLSKKVPLCLEMTTFQVKKELWLPVLVLFRGLSLLLALIDTNCSSLGRKLELPGLLWPNLCMQGAYCLLHSH